MGAIIEAIIYVFSGIGAAKVLDKVASDKVPNYPSDGISPKNIFWFAGIAVAAIVAFRFINKKFKIFKVR